MYKIIRFYQYSGRRPIIKQGLTLEEAQEHCEDPETSSSTCADKSHKDKHGPWFDGYTEE